MQSLTASELSRSVERRLVRMSVVVSALCLSLWATAALAQEQSERAKPTTVGRLVIEGAKGIDASRLRGVMLTKAPSRIPFSKKPRYVPSQIKEDVDRIEAFYRDRGYASARVRRVVVDVNPDNRTAVITFEIDEGLPRLAGALRFEGMERISPSRLRRVRAAGELEPGEPLDLQAVRNIQDAAVRALKDLGHAGAQVTVREVQEMAEAPVHLTFVAAPGPVVHFGEITLNGNAAVDDDVIQRELTFEPGALFSQRAIDHTSRNLRALNLFDFVYVEPRLAEVEGDAVPMRVTVSEGKHRQFDFGVGYGTEEKARAQVAWRNVNFTGHGRTIGVEGKASALDRGARASYTEPSLFSRDVSLSFEGHSWDEREPIYRMNSYGGQATLAWQHDRRDTVGRSGSLTSVGLTFINEFTSYSVADFALDDPSYRSQLISLGLDPVTGKAEGTLVALRLQLTQSSVVDLLDPRRGYSLSGAVERAGGFLPGDFTYIETSGEARHYQPFPGRIVLANRARVSAIDARVNGVVPFFKRYFLGGSTSLRGWGRYDISPLTESGLPIGGLALVELSSEVRLPVGEKLSFVAFVDAGNVWERPRDIDLSDLRVSVGPGVRYATPIGPIRLDFGYQLTPIDGLLVRGQPEPRHWRIHFSIGQAF